MSKLEQLREHRTRVTVLMRLMPGVARDAIDLLMQVIEEQQEQLDQLTAAVNRLTEKQGDYK